MAVAVSSCMCCRYCVIQPEYTIQHCAWLEQPAVVWQGLVQAVRAEFVVGPRRVAARGHCGSGGLEQPDHGGGYGLVAALLCGGLEGDLPA